MADDRYIRWQGLAISQLSVAVALISGLAVSSLAVGFSLLQNKEFIPCGAFKVMFAWSFPLLLLAALLSCIAVVSRLLDFRLTARKVRKDKIQDYSRPLKIFWLGPDAYGRITWGGFWIGCIAFLIGVVFLFASIGVTYANRRLTPATVGYSQWSTAPLTVTADFRGETVSLKESIGGGVELRVKVLNSTARTLEIRDMNCSIADAWQAERPLIHINPNSCTKNFPIFRKLGAGESFEEVLFVKLDSSIRKAHIDSTQSLRMGYRTYIRQNEKENAFDEPPFELIFWSRPVKFKVVE